MTLELGSWLWIRKNPLQLFSRHGIFNPIKAHRTRRVLRRHPNFFDFLTRAAFSSQRWLPRGEFREQVLQQRDRALVAQGHAMSQWILLRGLTRETRHWGAFARRVARTRRGRCAA